MAIKINGITVIDDARVGNLASADVTGNLTAGNVSGTNVGGTLTTAAQPNVTSVGTLTSLSVTGNLSAGNISATAGNFTTVSGNGLALTNVSASNIDTGTLDQARLANSTLSVNGSTLTLGGTSTITANAATLTGTELNSTVVTSSLTSVGTLGSLSVTGNIDGGNVNTDGTVVASTLESNVANGTAPLTVTSTTLVTNLNADLLDGYNSSISAVANTVVVRDANANVAANVFTGNSFNISGSAVIAGNLNVGGNIVYTNITDLNISDAVIGLGRGPNNTPLTTNDGKDRGTELWYYETSEKSAFFGYDNSLGKLIAATDVTNVVDVITVNSYGNLVVGGLEATTGAFTGNISADNVNGGNSVTANFFSGTLTTTAQSNITSVGTLTSLDVTGNITGGNVTTTGTANIGTLEVTGTADVTGNASVGGILTDNYYYANGTPVDFEQPAGSNTEIQFNNDGDFGASANLVFDLVTNTLSVVGDVNATDFNSTSDRTLKKDVSKIVNAREILEQIEPVQFKWVSSGKQAYGVIAQEIEKILPDLVTTNEETGLKSVAYIQMIPFLIQQIKDLTEEIDKLKNK
jgi:hypothetical protein